MSHRNNDIPKPNMSRRDIERQVALVTNGSAFEKTEAVRALGNLARVNAASRTAIGRAGGIAALVALATNGAAGGQKQAAWAFSRLAHDNAANRVAIREAGGIPPVVALVRSGAADCQEAAVMALGNLAYNNPANQAAIVAAGAVGPLVALVRVGAIRLGGHSREAEWALKMLDLAAIASRLQTLQAEEASRKRLRAPPPPRAGPGEECVVCFERARAVAFLPSGHFCVCSKCGQRLSECPICRKSTRKQRIYT